MNFRFFYVFVMVSLTIGCTTGKLHYIDTYGNRKLACEVEFIGIPSVDKFAVEYALSLCAKSAVKKGFRIEQPELLDIDTSIKPAPCNDRWTHPLAKRLYKEGSLSQREYGYIVAHIDFGFATTNECNSDDI